ncbi:MAG: hypothetical protein AAGE59_20500 [Cyanobacteria bacterium P01_F01_bin.86]
MPFKLSLSASRMIQVLRLESPNWVMAALSIFTQLQVEQSQSLIYS